MIRRPEDYHFVDFAAGDMPTDLFNGEIFPLRNEPRALKGEDIAFAYEAAAARLKALDGAESGAGFVYHAPAVEVLTPTRVLSANQMNAVTAKINAVAAMKPDIDYSKYDDRIGELAIGFLESELAEVPAELLDSAFLSMYRERILPHCVSGEIAEVRPGDPVLYSHLENCYGTLKKTSRVIIRNSLSNSSLDGEMELINGVANTYFETGVYREQIVFVGFSVEREYYSQELRYSVYANSLTPLGKLPKSSIKSVDRVFAILNGTDFSADYAIAGRKTALMDITDGVDISIGADTIELTMSAQKRLSYFLRFVTECGAVWPVNPGRGRGFYDTVAFQPYFICELNDRTTW